MVVNYALLAVPTDTFPARHHQLRQANPLLPNRHHRRDVTLIPTARSGASAITLFNAGQIGALALVKNNLRFVHESNRTEDLSQIIFYTVLPEPCGTYFKMSMTNILLCK